MLGQPFLDCRGRASPFTDPDLQHEPAGLASRLRYVGHEVQNSTIDAARILSLFITHRSSLALIISAARSSTALSASLSTRPARLQSPSAARF